MATRFLYRVTVIAHSTKIAEANVLAATFGLVPADADTFGHLWDGTDTYTYACFHFDETNRQTILAAKAAAEAQPEPLRSALLALDVYDLDAAQAAQTGRITAIIGPNVLNPIPVHMAAAGLSL